MLKVISVDINTVVPNSWNPNKQSEYMYQKTIASIAKFGFVEPLIVRKVGVKYEIINGEHRLRACIDLDYSEIPIINLGTIAEDVAKQLTLALNDIHGEDDATTLAALLVELESDVGMVQLLEALPFTEEFVNELIDAVDIPGIVEDITELETDDEWVSMSFSIPKAAIPVIESEFDRIGEAMGVKPDLSARVRNGLILEMVCANSAGIPTESLE